MGAEHGRNVLHNYSLLMIKENEIIIIIIKKKAIFFLYFLVVDVSSRLAESGEKKKC